MNSGALSNDLIQLKNLNKVSTKPAYVLAIRFLLQSYGGHFSGCNYQAGIHAVKGLNLGIPKGECFGLLGVNG